MLNVFFNPKSVALIGATDRPGSVGLGICKNLLEGREKRRIFFVNPNEKRILGKETYPSVNSIKEKVDLVIVAVPAPIVSKIIRECVQKNARGIIVISSGFAEIGKIGKRRQEEIVKILKSSRIPLLGPNCLGVIRPSTKLNASFSPATPKKGKIAFLSQSGALIDSIIDQSLLENYGFSALVSYGNEADLSICDFLKFFGDDKETEVLALYIEGLKDGRDFIKVAGEVGKKKPIIVLKGGKTEIGRKTASSHTGALAGIPEIYSAVFKKTKIFEVETIEELLGVSLALSLQPPCYGGIGVVTNGGACGVLTADYCAKFGVNLVNLNHITKNKLKKSGVMNPVFSPGNPLDIIGDALSERYKVAVETLLEQENIQGLIVIQTLQIMTEVEKNAKVVIEAKKKYPKKPIVCCFMGGKKTLPAVNLLKKFQIPNYLDPKQAALAMKGLIFKGNILR